MCRVGRCRRRDTPTHRVELPDQPGIALPSYGRSDLLDPVVAPQPADATERRYPALGANPRSGKNEEAVGGENDVFC